MRFIILATLVIISYATPIAVFHGFGDFCAQPGMVKFTKELGTLTGEYSACIEIGNGSESSILMDFREQAQQACENLKADPNLAGQTINVVGLSQGALLARSIVENCDFGGRVSKWLSIGGPNMGVSAFPHCEGGIFCYPVNHVTKALVYSNYIQNHVGPAGYFRDVSNLETYLSSSHFLPDLNNERSFSSERKDRFSSLDGVMLVKFTEDTMIFPKETSWFQQWDENGTVIALEETDFYVNDFIGLKTLNEANKVQFIEVVGDHLRFSQEDIEQQFIPFLTQ